MKHNSSSAKFVSLTGNNIWKLGLLMYRYLLCLFEKLRALLSGGSERSAFLGCFVTCNIRSIAEYKAPPKSIFWNRYTRYFLLEAEQFIVSYNLHKQPWIDHVEAKWLRCSAGCQECSSALDADTSWQKWPLTTYFYGDLSNYSILCSATGTLHPTNRRRVRHQGFNAVQNSRGATFHQWEVSWQEGGKKRKGKHRRTTRRVSSKGAHQFPILELVYLRSPLRSHAVIFSQLFKMGYPRSQYLLGKDTLIFCTRRVWINGLVDQI